MNYEQDIIVWAQQQSHLLRTQQFDLLDITHIVEELEAVGKSEQRELAHRMAVLISHLLKWKFQPERRGRSWQLTIRHQRRAIQLHLKQVPSLKTKLNDSEWLETVWGDAVYQAMQETGLDDLPEFCLWSISEILSDEWLP
jgi:Domain of unknown function DUF29